jgi:hypothetical protein
MKITTSKLLRFCGLALVPAGIVFAGIQPIHPPDVVESVTTTAWGIITSLKYVMSVLFLVGITGLYARQADKAGLLGLVAFLVLATSWTLQSAYVFAEAFILPPLAATAPEFVDAMLGISYGHTGNVNLGALPTIYSLGVGINYMLGGLLFGIATFRAGILPRVPAGLLAIAATLTPLAGLLPHAQQRYAAIPVALALAWLGYTLWSERRASVAQAAPASVGAQLRPAAAK